MFGVRVGAGVQCGQGVQDEAGVGDADRDRLLDGVGCVRYRRGFDAPVGELDSGGVVGVIDGDHDVSAADQFLDQDGAAVAGAAAAG